MPRRDITAICHSLRCLCYRVNENALMRHAGSNLLLLLMTWSLYSNNSSRRAVSAASISGLANSCKRSAGGLNGMAVSGASTLYTPLHITSTSTFHALGAFTLGPGGAWSHAH